MGNVGIQLALAARPCVHWPLQTLLLVLIHARQPIGCAPFPRHARASTLAGLQAARTHGRRPPPLSLPHPRFLPCRSFCSRDKSNVPTFQRYFSKIRPVVSDSNRFRVALACASFTEFFKRASPHGTAGGRSRCALTRDTLLSDHGWGGEPQWRHFCRIRPAHRIQRLPGHSKRHGCSATTLQTLFSHRKSRAWQSSTLPTKASSLPRHGRIARI